MKLSSTDLVALERAGMKMFNPIARREAGAWTAIVSAVPNRRANAIYPLGPVPDRLDSLVSLYPLHGRLVRVKTPDWVDPTTRDALRSLRLHPVYGAHVMVGDARAGMRDGDASRVVMTNEIDRRWLDVNRDFPSLAATAYGFDGTSTVAARIGDVSVGLMVLADGWAGIGGMYTAPAQRRQGMATEILMALLGSAVRQGVERAFLQVVESNGPAVRMYSAHGFKTVSAYEYWE